MPGPFGKIPRPYTFSRGSRIISAIPCILDVRYKSEELSFSPLEKCMDWGGILKQTTVHTQVTFGNGNSMLGCNVKNYLLKVTECAMIIPAIERSQNEWIRNRHKG